MSHKFYGYIYLIQNIQNNKIYIGKTVKNPIKYIKKHFQYALREASPTKYFYNAIRKYGKENFKIKILGEIISRSIRNLNKKLNQVEIECIFHFRSFGSNGINYDDTYGYNQTKGGDGWQKGSIPWNKGLVGIYSEEAKQKMSETRKIKLDSGEIIPWNKGLTKETDERVKKYGESNKNHIVTEDTRNKIGKANSGENCGMYGKSVYSVWIEKYGVEEADKKEKEKRRKSSESQLNKKRSPESVIKGEATKKRNRELKKLYLTQIAYIINILKIKLI